MNIPPDLAAAGAARFSHSSGSAAPVRMPACALTLPSVRTARDSLAAKLRGLEEDIATSSFSRPIKDMLRARFERVGQRFVAGDRQLSRVEGSNDHAGLMHAMDSLTDAGRRAVAIFSLMRNDVPPYDLEQARLAEPVIAQALSSAGPRELDGVLDLVMAYDISDAALHDEALLNLVVGFTALNIAIVPPAQAASPHRPTSGESPPRQMPVRKPMPSASRPLGPATPTQVVATDRGSRLPGDVQAMARSLQGWAHPIEEDFLARVLLCVADPAASKDCWMPAPLLGMTDIAAKEAQCKAREPGKLRRDVLIETIRDAYADHVGLLAEEASQRNSMPAQPPQGDAEQECFKEVVEAFLSGKKLPRYLDSYCAQLMTRRV